MFYIILISHFNCRKDCRLPEVITIRIGLDEEHWHRLYFYVGEGRVISDGGGDLLDSGFCYSSTNESPTINDSVSSENIIIDDNGSFISKLNLQKGQVKYFLRAFAKNKAGISYGVTLTYTTYCETDPEYNRLAMMPPYLIFPSNGATGMPLSINLLWIVDPSGSSSDLYLDTSPNAGGIFATNVSRTYGYMIDNLKPSTTYYWKVVKHYSTCADISSTTYNFTTAP